MALVQARVRALRPLTVTPGFFGFTPALPIPLLKATLACVHAPVDWSGATGGKPEPPTGGEGTAPAGLTSSY